MRRFCAVLCAALLLFTLPACRKGEGVSFRLPLAAEPTSLDPQTAEDEAARTVIDSLFEGLCRPEGGKVVPAAATWTVSDDGCTYTFSLSASLWSDGAAVTADDFVFAFERRSQAAMFASVNSVRAVAPHTLQVTLNAPDTAFLFRVANKGWFPCRRDFFDKCNGAYGMERDSLVTNGAFTLKSWDHGHSLLLQRHEGYHHADEITPTAVRFVIGATQNTEALGNTLDACRLDAPTAAVSTVTVEDTLQYLWFNTAAAPFTTAAVRRAFRDAVDWQAITPLLATPTVSFVSPAATLHGSAYSHNLPPYQTVVDRAAFSAALAAQGISALPSLTLLCDESTASFTLAQYLVQSWQKHLGVYLSIEPLSSASLTARMTAGNFTLALATRTANGNTPADALAMFTGNRAVQNPSRLQDAAWESMWSRAQTTADWQAAEQQLHALCPAVPLSVAPRTFGFASDVRNMAVVPFTERIDFRHATREK